MGKMAAPPPQGHRYGNMEEDEDDDATAPDAVDGIISTSHPVPTN